MASDYGRPSGQPKKGGMWDSGKVDSGTNSGDKAIPPGMPGSAAPGKGVQSFAKPSGDNGIPPMNANPTAKAPKD